jgi:hypothetical protein
MLTEEGDRLAPALGSTTRIEKLALRFNHISCGQRFLDSIGRNRSIRALVLKGRGPLLCSEVTSLWKSVLKSATIQSVDASELPYQSANFTFSPKDRRTCAAVVAAAIRSNPHVTRILYDSRVHDAHIMESRVVPILHFNKFRPIVGGLFEGSSRGIGRERAVSALLGSPLVRRHPELLFFLLKANRENLLAASGLGRRRRADPELTGETVGRTSRLLRSTGSPR